MALTMASTLAVSRPSEKFGTHSTNVDIGEKNSWRLRKEAREVRRSLRPSRPSYAIFAVKGSRLPAHKFPSNISLRVSVPEPALIAGRVVNAFPLSLWFLPPLKIRMTGSSTHFVHGRRDQDAPCRCFFSGCPDRHHCRPLRHLPAARRRRHGTGLRRGRHHAEALCRHQAHGAPRPVHRGRPQAPAQRSPARLRP